MHSRRARARCGSAWRSHALATFVCGSALLACGPGGSRFASELTQLDGGVPDGEGAAGSDPTPSQGGGGGPSPATGGVPATAGISGGAGAAGAGGTIGVAGAMAGGGTTGAAGKTGTGGTTGGSAGMTASGGSAGIAGKPGTGGAGMTGSAGATGTGGTPPPTDTASFNFEADAQGWADLRSKNTPVARVAGGAFAGNGSLEATLTTTMAGEDRVIGVGADKSPPIPNGATLTYHVWYPAGAPIMSVQPYVLDRNMNGVITWTGAYTTADKLQAGQWNTIKLQYPASVYQLLELGVEFKTTTGWTGKVRVDAVSW